MRYIKHHQFVAVLLLLSCACFFVRYSIDTAAMNAVEVKVLKYTQQTYSTELVIKNDPQYANFSSKVVASDRAIDQRVIAVGDGKINDAIASLRVGDTISVQGYLSELDPYQQYREREHVVGIFHIDTLNDRRHSHSILDQATQKMRGVIEKGCSRLGRDERGVCEGLLIGNRTHIDRELYDTYRKAQLTHLLVASGANIAFLVGFIQPLLTRMRINTRSIILICVAVFYCVATRCEPSIVRACVMAIIPALADMRGMRISKSRIFITTLIACVLIDPFLVYRVGFWLSLCATGGLYFVSPILVKYVRYSILANTLGATLCVQPVLWVVFGFQLPVRWWASVIAVAIAEPLTTAGMVALALASFLSPSSWLSKGVTSLVHLGCATLNLTARIGASDTGYWLGCAFSLAGIIAYTCRYIAILRSRKSKKAMSGHGRQERILYYRR